jgi:hypothetical protein
MSLKVTRAFHSFSEISKEAASLIFSATFIVGTMIFDSFSLAKQIHDSPLILK